MAELYIPPPPYETSQEEFDSKTAQALEISTSTSDLQPGPRSQAREDDQWDNFDEAAFEAAFEAAVRQRESQGGSSSTGLSDGSAAKLSTRLSPEKWERPTSPAVQPLRIHKRTPSDTQPKERPSWFAEANLGECSTFQPLSGPPGPYRETSRSPSHPSEQDGDHTQAPPPFQSIGPSLDGPPLVEVVMAYHGNGSAPPSPLSSSPPPVHSPHPSHPQSRHNPSLSSSPQPRIPSRSPRPHPHQSLPPPARRAPQRLSPRPTTSFTPTINTLSQPHMNFDHTVAYTRRDDNVSPTTEPKATNAAAFYNSAVSSHLAAPSKPTQRSFQPYADRRQSQYHSRQPIGGTTLPNISPTYSVPSFMPHVLQQGAVPPAQPSIPSGVQTHQYPPYPGDAQARWATSEEQIRRNF